MEGEIRIDYGAAEPLVFADSYQLFLFSVKQLSIWKKLQERFEESGLEFKHSYGVMLSGRLKRQVSTWEDLRGVGEFAEISLSEEFINSINSKLKKRELLLGDDSLVLWALDCPEKDFRLSAFILCIYFSDIARVFSQPNFNAEAYQWYANGLALLSTSKAAENNIKLIRDQYSHVRDHYVQLMSKSESVLENLRDEKEKLESEIAKSINVANDAAGAISREWQHLRSTYDNALKLSAPKTYWGSKKQDHQYLARQWRRGFLVSALLGACLITVCGYMMVYYWASLATPLGNHAWVIPLLMVGIPAFMTLWILRLCGRQWTEHMNREEDARERIVMIETFLALSRSEDSPNTLADSAQLALVLGAIFRAGPGFGSDDSPPAGVMEALIAKLGASSRN